MSHLPRKPVRLVEQNDELLDIQKSTAAEFRPEVDYKGPTEDAFRAQMQPQYRTPPDRVNGNEIFRRYPDGKLDYGYAKNKVIDAIHKVRDKVEPTGFEKMALSACYPGVFGFEDDSMSSYTAGVTLRMSMEERLRLCAMVSAHLSKEMAFMLSCHAR